MSSDNPSRWQTVELGDLCSFRSGSAFKLNRQGKSVGTYPFIKVRDLSHVENIRFIWASDNWVDDADVTALKAKPFSAGTVVFAKIGEALKANRFRVLVRDTLIDNNMMGATPHHACVDPKFFPYLLQELDLPSLATGSAMPYLKQSDLVKMQVHLPPLAEQRRIAEVLGSLDDKMEINQRIARIAEEIVAAAFKARFIDFIEDDDLVESEIGLIPRGWSAESLDELSGLHRELTKGPSDLPYLGLDDMPRGSTVLANWRTVGAPTGQSAKFAEGDILFGKLRPYFRKVGVTLIDGRCSTEILVLRPNDPFYYGFLLGHVSSQRFIDHCVAVSRGTRMPRAEWKDAGGYKVAVPPRDVAASFTALTKTFYRFIRVLVHESHTINVIRNTILPQLISGQVRIPAKEQPPPVDA